MSSGQTDAALGRVRLNTLLLPVATLLLLWLEIIDTAGIWRGLLAASGGLWLIGYVWARSLQKNLSMERAMRFGWRQVGDKLEEELSLYNDGLFPATWLELMDHSTLPGYAISRATGVDGMSENTWRTAGTCTRRGVYQLGGSTLRTGDPLGIYVVEVELPQSTWLTVLPPIIPLPSIEVTPGGWLGEGRPRANAPEKTVTASALREYTPGDSQRLVHWPTTARHNELFVRQLEGAPAGDWWLALDVDAAAQAGFDESDSTLELGIILAASLADQGIRAHRSVGLATSGDEPAWMRPQGGEHRRWEILRALAQVNAGHTPLAKLLESIGQALGREASLIVITPSSDSEWIEPLARLFWRGISPTVLLIDAATFGGRGNASSQARLLNEVGIRNHVLTRDLLLRPEARPGEQGQWDWRVMPTGKAIATRKPIDTSWKKL